MAITIYRFIAYRKRSGGYYITIKDVTAPPPLPAAVADSKPHGASELLNSQVTDIEQKNDDMVIALNNIGATQTPLGPGRDPVADAFNAKASDLGNALGRAALNKLAEEGGEDKASKRTTVDKVFAQQVITARPDAPSAVVPAAHDSTVGAAPAVGDPDFPNRLGWSALQNLAKEAVDSGPSTNTQTDKATSLKNLAANSTVRKRRVATGTHEKSINSLLAGGDPIAMFGPEGAGPGDILGDLILMESTAPALANTVRDESPGDRFQIVYMRPDPPQADASGNFIVAADDAAVIVRTFMLARIAVARMEMRDALQELANQRNEVKPLAASPWAIVEDRAASVAKWGRDLVQRRKGRAVAVGAFLFAWLLFWVWIPYGGNYQDEALLSQALFGCLALGAAFFLINALNLKSIDDRLKEKIHEEAVERLRAILESLVQTNANVASINLSVPLPDRVSHAIPSEKLLEHMDGALKVKERFNSIAAVIKARQAHVVDGAKHIEEHRDRVRRSITAAGSGVFVGFFTYEVGESVMNYLHVTHQQDSSAMFYWLAANGDRIRASANAAARANAGHADSGTVAHAPALHPDFIAAYHRPELYAHSWLLTITIIVSALTAWIAMRKPAAEQAGGHGHH